MITRRSFIIASGLTALASTRVFGANDTLRIGVIGAGQRMKGLLGRSRQSGAIPDRCRVRRVCAASRSRQRTVERPGHHASGLSRGPRRQRDRCGDHRFAGPLARAHGGDALAAGKDVYLEKPVTHTIEEGETLTKARAFEQADTAVRHAAAQLDALPRRGRSDPGRQPGAGHPGAHILVAELRRELAAEAD